MQHDWAERAADLIVARFEALNEEYLRRVGERIRAIGRISPTDLYRLERMRDVGADMDAMKARLSRETGKALSELENLFASAAKEAAKPYDELKNSASYLYNEQAAALAAAQYKETGRALVNLSRTTVRAQAYQRLVDRAVSAVQLGTEDYAGAIRSALRETAWAGLCVDENGTRKVRYASGLTRRLDTAMRQNVLDGARALYQHTTDAAGEAFGADGVEITAHMLCAEDHLPYQGKQMSKEAFEQLLSVIPRRFGVWNCGHHCFPIILGVNEPAYTEEELSQYRKYSTERITIDGKTKTRYQWSQAQRRLETATRRQKDVAVAAKAAGDDVLRREAQAKINDYRKRYAQVSREAGLDERTDKMAVSGFHRVKVDENLIFIDTDAKIKASSDLPKLLKGLPDETLKATADVDFAIVKGVVPKGVSVTSVVVLAGAGTKTPIRDLKRLYAAYPKVGSAAAWQKKSGVVKTDHFRYELHWYENAGTVPAGEIKTKDVKK